MSHHGCGWIIYEESYQKGTRELISILPPRRTTKYVSDFMRQIYIDRWSSINGRLSFKKSPKSEPYKVMMGTHQNPMHIGHDPSLVGIYAHKIMLSGSNLEFVYRILTNIDDKFRPTFEERRQSFVVAA